MSPQCCLPVELILEIGKHADFFSALYMGALPCLCRLESDIGCGSINKWMVRYHIRQWVEKNKEVTDRNKQAQSWRCKIKSYLCRMFMKSELPQRRSRRLNSIIECMQLQLISSHSHHISLEVWIQVWNNMNEIFREYRITRYNEEGILLLWCCYNAQAHWNQQYATGADQLHYACFRNAVRQLKLSLLRYHTDDFERKRDF